MKTLQKQEINNERLRYIINILVINIETELLGSFSIWQHLKYLVKHEFSKFGLTEDDYKMYCLFSKKYLPFKEKDWRGEYWSTYGEFYVGKDNNARKVRVDFLKLLLTKI